MIDISDLAWDDDPEYDNCQPLEAVLLIKALDADGNLTLIERTTQGITAWEMVGMATTFADGVRRYLLNES